MVQVADIKTRSIQGEQLNASIDRLANVILGEGVLNRLGDSFQVTQDTGSNMFVKVGSGTAYDRCVISSDELGGGTYILEHQDPNVTLAIAAAHATNDRIDLVIARVYDDTFDTSGNEYGDIEVVTGTPAGSPTPPTLPEGAISLAQILVQNAVTAITDADITDTRIQAVMKSELTGSFWQLFYPVGSVYISVVATSPATLFGGGTWSAFGTGRVLVGIDAGDTDFDTVEETGGVKTHTHTMAHTHQIDPPSTTSAIESQAPISGTLGTGSVVATDDHTHTFNIAAFTSGASSAANTGSGSNVQPYIVVHMWKRTA